MIGRPGCSLFSPHTLFLWKKKTKKHCAHVYHSSYWNDNMPLFKSDLFLKPDLWRWLSTLLFMSDPAGFVCSGFIKLFASVAVVMTRACVCTVRNRWRAFQMWMQNKMLQKGNTQAWFLPKQSLWCLLQLRKLLNVCKNVFCCSYDQLSIFSFLTHQTWHHCHVLCSKWC